MVALIKPQFEVGRDAIGKGGIVRDPLQHERAKQKVVACAEQLGGQVRGICDSPITGADGNREFLIHIDLE